VIVKFYDPMVITNPSDMGTKWAALGSISSTSFDARAIFVDAGMRLRILPRWP